MDSQTIISIGPHQGGTSIFLVHENTDAMIVAKGSKHTCTEQLRNKLSYFLVRTNAYDLTPTLS